MPANSDALASSKSCVHSTQGQGRNHYVMQRMKFMFYPFDDRKGIDKYHDLYEGWAKDGKAWGFLDPRDSNYKVLSEYGEDQDNKLYIFGHSADGSDYLRSQTSFEKGETSTGHNKTVNADELVSLLVESGLLTDAHLTIKLLNCHSGEYWEDFPSFATKLKYALREYPNVTVHGYVGALTLMPTRRGDVGGPVRKFAIFGKEQGRSEDLGKKAFRGRDLRFAATGDFEIDRTRADEVLVRVRTSTEDTGITL